MPGPTFPAYIKAVYKEDKTAYDQFVSDVGRAGGKAKTAMEQALSGVRDTVAQALSVPRNAFGSLDVGVGELRKMEAQLEATAQASREVQKALIAEARSTDGATQSKVTAIRASNQFARAKEEELASLRQSISFNERLQAELSKTASATSQVVNATGRGTTAFSANGESLRGQRQAMVQTGQQLQDLGISLYSGQRASTVFAQQLPQLAFALTSLEGSANKTAAKIGSFAAILSGPLGSVALVAASVGLGVLVEKLFFADKETDKAAKSTLDLVDALSKEKFGSDEATKAIDEYVAAQKRSRNAIEDNITLALESAKARLTDALSTREQIATEYELQKAFAARSTRGAGGGTDPLVIVNNRQAGLVAANDAAIAKARSAINELTISDAKRLSIESVDPLKRINRQYDDMAAKAIKAADGNQKLADSLAGVLKGIEKNRKAAVDGQKASEKSSRGSRGNPSGVLTDFLIPIDGRITSDIGLRRRPNAGATANHGGIDIAAKIGTPVRAPAGGVIIESGTLGKYGKVVFIDHGAGTISRLAHLSDNSQFKKGDVVERGDIVGKSGDTGNVTGPHLHYEVRQNGKIVNPRIAKFATDGLGAQAQNDNFEKERERLAVLERVSASAADGIAAVNAQFDDQPRLIDQSAAAVRKLEGVLAELNKDENKDTPRLDALKKDALDGIIKAQNAVGADFQRETDSFNDRLNIQRLILAGRVDEGAVAERIAQLEQKYGTEKKLESLREQLAVQQDILSAEESTQAQRDAASSEIKKISSEYSKVADFVAKVRRDVTGQYAQEKAISEAIEKRNASVQRYQSLLNSTYSGLEDLLSGGKAGDFLKGIRQQFQQLQGQNLAESLFGDSFRELKKFSERNNPENIAARDLIERMDMAGSAAKKLADELIGAANKISGAANDNTVAGAVGSATGEASGEAVITVIGRLDRSIKDSARYTAGQFSLTVAQGIVNPLIENLNNLLGTNFFTQFSGILSGALSGFQRAGKTGAVLGGLQGLFSKLSDGATEGSKGRAELLKIAAKFESALAGAQTGDQAALIGRSFGIKTSRLGGQLGGALGGAVGGPLGSIIGGALGSVVGGLFKKTKSGSLILNSATGDFQTSGKLGSQLSGAGNSIQSSLNSIAERLGGSVGAFNVSIGKRGEYYRVSGDGSSNVGGKKSRNISGLIYDGKDEAEATRIALLNAIQDGAITGIRQGAQRLLATGKNLEAQVDKALRLQSIFDRLKEIEDPAAFAMEKLNKEFASLRSVAVEAGEGLVELERLYGLERAKVIEETTERLSGSIKSLLADLRTGDNGLGLRDRLANARAIFDPLANTVRSGGTVDADKFAEAARTVIDLQRQVDGSQAGYFAVFNDIIGLSETALERQRASIAAASAAGSPFTSPTPSNDNTPVVSAINSQTASLLGGLAALQAQIARLGGANNAPSAAPAGYLLQGGSYF